MMQIMREYICTDAHRFASMHIGKIWRMAIYPWWTRDIWPCATFRTLSLPIQILFLFFHIFLHFSFFRSSLFFPLIETSTRLVCPSNFEGCLQHFLCLSFRFFVLSLWFASGFSHQLAQILFSNTF